MTQSIVSWCVWEVTRTPTNLQIDDHLIEEAMRLGGHRTKSEAVAQAVAEYVRRLKQERIIDMFGTLDVDPTYDYRQQRGSAPSGD